MDLNSYAELAVRLVNTAGAGVGALAGGIVTNIGWNLFVSQGGAAVFIGLAGSVAGLLLGHAVSVLSGGKHIAPAVADGRIITESVDVSGRTIR